MRQIVFAKSFGVLTVRERFLLLVLIELGEFLSKDRAAELVVHHRKEEIRSIVGGGAGSFNSAFSRLVSLGVLSSIEHPSYPNVGAVCV